MSGEGTRCGDRDRVFTLLAMGRDAVHVRGQLDERWLGIEGNCEE
jgi:hypothetical protein